MHTSTRFMVSPVYSTVLFDKLEFFHNAMNSAQLSLRWNICQRGMWCWIWLGSFAFELKILVCCRSVRELFILFWSCAKLGATRRKICSASWQFVARLIVQWFQVPPGNYGLWQVHGFWEPLPLQLSFLDDDFAFFNEFSLLLILARSSLIEFQVTVTEIYFSFLLMSGVVHHGYKISLSSGWLSPVLLECSAALISLLGRRYSCLVCGSC